MTKNFLFYKKLGLIELQNNFQQLAFLDLFIDDTIRLITVLKFGK